MDQFAKGPAFGFGGMACSRTELHEEWLKRGDAPKHPHNAYLELLLDMGVIGFVPVMLLYGGIFLMSWQLFRDRRDNLAAAVGGMGLACISVLMVTALGCQSFYPTQSTLLCWCIWGIAVRVAVDRGRVLQVEAAGYGTASPPGGRRDPVGIAAALQPWHVSGTGRET